jgi:hypothetical protein
MPVNVQMLEQLTQQITWSILKPFNKVILIIFGVADMCVHGRGLSFNLFIRVMKLTAVINEAHQCCEPNKNLYQTFFPQGLLQ